MLGGTLIAYIPATAFKLLLIANGSLVIGISVGALVGAFGLMLLFVRPLRVLLGVLILMLSLVSFFTSDFGGLLLGMLMGLVGGSLALAWVPTKVTWRQKRRARKPAPAGEGTHVDEPDVLDIMTERDVAESDEAVPHRFGWRTDQGDAHSRGGG